MFIKEQIFFTRDAVKGEEMSKKNEWLYCFKSKCSLNDPNIEKNLRTYWLVSLLFFSFLFTCKIQKFKLNFYQRNDHLQVNT